MEREFLGVYELKRLLGRGGMGAVYVAHDPRLARDVALKVLSPELAKQPEFRERFLSEARSCSSLNHPNITTIHEIGEASGTHFIAFELVDGDTLETLLSREGPLPPSRVLELALPIARGLHYAHERGVIHRDLKPSNVVVSSLGVPKLLDFGLAKAVTGPVGSESETLVRLTQAGMVVGTLAYMSPEQLRAEAVDPRSDVFSFGCLLYEMATGEPPFAGRTPAQRIESLLTSVPERVDRLRPEVPSALADVIAACLEKPAGDRPASMAEVESLLRGVESGGVARGGLRPLGRRRGWVAGLVAASGLVATALFLADGERGGSADRRSLAVMYFENLTEPADDSSTAAMMTQLLSGELADLDDTRVVSRQRLHDVRRELGLGAGPIDRATATEVAGASGVDVMVVGQVAVTEDALVATTELVDVRTGRTLSAQRAGAESSGDVFGLASSLATQVRGELDAPQASGASGPSHTASVDAYRHYVRGETALQDQNVLDAVEAFQEAVAADPEFALAQHRLSIAARWASDGPLSHQAARRAARALDRLPEGVRGVAEANALYQDGAYSRAIPLLERALEEDPLHKEALYLLSQIYVHSLRDGNPERALELMESLLESDPAFRQIHDRLALTHAFTGNPDRARALMAVWRERWPDEVAGLRSILATLEGQPEETLGFGQAFSWIEGPLFQASAAMMAERWDVARRMVEQGADDWRSDHLRAWSLRNRGVFHAYVGEFDRAVEFLDRAGGSIGFRTHEGASAGVPASALQTLAELYLLSGDVSAAREELDRALSMQPESWRGLYFAGRMALFDDDPEAAERHHRTLEALPAVERSAAARLYRDALAAERALYDGEVASARRLFADVVSRPLLLDWSSTCSSAGAVFLEGLARAASADEDAAAELDALERLVESGAARIDHPVVYMRAVERLSVLYVERGDRLRGERLLERFLRSWGDSDWELELVDEARTRQRL